MGTVDGRGYDDQLKYTIWDTCRPCHSILSTLKPVFHHTYLTYSLCLQLAQVRRSPDLAIFLSTTTTQPVTLLLTHVHGINIGKSNCMHDCVCLINLVYRSSLKSRRTSKSRHPWNVAASICQLVPINAALEISPHGKGSTTISVCARTFYVHTTRLIIEAVYTRAYRSL